MAKLIGVHLRTLYRWLYAGWLPEPKQVVVGRTKVRLWSPQDVQRAVDLKLSLERGRRKKGREAKVDKRLMELHRHLAWYSQHTKLTPAESRAFRTLQEGLRRRLREAGLEW